MKFEIVNPSDPYTMEAEDLEIAAVAACILGRGAYPLKSLDQPPGEDVPPFLFGGHDEWFRQKFGVDFEGSMARVMERRKAALAACFESVTLTEGERSSMNDIGGHAKQVARQLRNAITEGAPR